MIVFLNKFLNYFIIIFLVLITVNGCKKKDTDKSYLTIPLPVVSTYTLSNLLQTKVTCGGNITSDGGLPIIARGVCWSRDNIPTITDSKTKDSTGIGYFTSSVTGLISSTEYKIRAYASNRLFTGYGETYVFITPRENATDIDGNVYHVINIGTQVWMVENLKVTKYRNGNPISYITESDTWASASTGAYCNYNNSSSYVSTYGRLYNLYAVTDSRKIAPYGWHVATDSDWSILITFLGGTQVAGSALKEIGTLHWQTNISDVTNSYGFTGLPGGCRKYNDGTFQDFGITGYWWSPQSGNYYSSPYNYQMYGINNIVEKKINQYSSGLSVRCIKD